MKGKQKSNYCIDTDPFYVITVLQQVSKNLFPNDRAAVIKKKKKALRPPKNYPHFQNVLNFTICNYTNTLMSSHLKKCPHLINLLKNMKDILTHCQNVFSFKKNNIITGSVNSKWIGAYGALLSLVRPFIHPIPYTFRHACFSIHECFI